MNLGCHLSVGDGFLEMGTVASSINANTFQFFTRNPRGGSVKPINTDDISNLNEYLKKNNFAKVVAHAPFIMNLAAKEESKRQYAVSVLQDDIMRMELLPNNYYNLHPGAHTGQGIGVGVEKIAKGLNEALYEDMTTTILLETMTGKGSEIGGTFEDLKAIYDGVELKEKVGFCLDTCHVFDGGYDIVNNLEGVLSEFDRILGIENLKAIHLNDSMNVLGSRKDRHAKIGEGNIGLEALVKVLTHPYLKELPFVLETPNDVEGYSKEIELLRGICNG
ncbi:MAG: deoxyribonuclease IV [Clostridia bacterium]|nr:deoxyribonuclease IV [Clostridia bacterium]